MQQAPLSPKVHTWTFFRSGGLLQAALESGSDLLALDSLDPKLWVALSCPVRGLELDEKTLALIDTDKDGHIRVPEVIAAAKWAGTRLKDAGILLRGADALPLDAIDQGSPEGQMLMTAARQILARLDRADADSIRVEDTSNLAKAFSTDKLAGDGVMAPEAAHDGETQHLLRDILSCMGGETGASGATGVTVEKVRAFFEEASAYATWMERGASPVIAVLGDRTSAAHEAIAAVRSKVEDYFARSRLATFEPRALDALNRSGENFESIAAHDLTTDGKEIAALPLARIEPGKPLPLRQGANPAWAAALAALYRDAVTPLFGADRTTLSAGDWTALTGRFSAYESWLAAKAGGSAERLGLERVRTILEGRGRTEIEALAAEDRSLKPVFAAVTDLDRLVRYHRDLRTLLQNFVNFADFYSRDRAAVFQAGFLFIDSRSCELCIRVEDPDTHAKLAGHSRTYIAYIECRRAESQAMKVAACVTQGDTDYLYVGRIGVFYDRAGRDWDATVTKIIENPTSIRQAFFAPYKRVARFVEDQFATFAASKDKAPLDGLAQGTAATADALKPAAQSFDIAKFAGIFAAIGLALGAMGGAVASVATGFMRLQAWQMPLALVGALMLISGPSMIVAALKLRQRNVGPILEASGWAINSRVKITRPLGNALTELAALPPGASRRSGDPYADNAVVVRRVAYAIIALILIALLIAHTERFWPFR